MMGRATPFLIAAATLALTACAQNLQGIDPYIDRALQGIDSAGKVADAHEKANEAFTPEESYYVGRAVSAQILSQYEVYEDYAATRYVNELGQTLAQFTDGEREPFRGYRFVLLDSDEINAFAAPGSYVFISRGMLRVCDTEDELAAILAHEIAHVVNGDAIKAIKQARGTDFLTTLSSEIAKYAPSLSSTRLAESLGDAAGDAFKTLSVTGYSRGSERDADFTGLVILERAGYPKGAMTSMLTKMKAKLRPGGLDFVKTHPSPDQRIATLKPKVGSDPAETNPARQSRFDKALAATRG